ncbi:MAG TPA: hypothetical protein VMF55_09580 [Solirubrobacterales bacterium]|nr:hypothetical protein [Solirubrobacterales bacterium]
MKTKALTALALFSLLLACAAAPADAAREVVHLGNLFLADDGGIFPSTLPRHGNAPISARLEAEIGTTDGSHPPALRHIDLDIDRTIGIDAAGLPTCKLGRIEATSGDAAKRACPEAIIGSGWAKVEVAFPEQAPFSSTGPVVLFNGGVRGKTTTVLLHAYVDVPAPTAIVVPARVVRVEKGRTGLEIVATIPPIAGGAGSVTAFRLTVGRRFTSGGRSRSLLTAGCPSGHYRTDGEAEFADGTVLSVNHVFPCTPSS